MKNALKDLDLGHLWLDKADEDKIQDLVEALSIAECCSRMLCQRDCSLSEADRVWYS